MMHIKTQENVRDITSWKGGRLQVGRDTDRFANAGKDNLELGFTHVHVRVSEHAITTNVLEHSAHGPLGGASVGELPDLEELRPSLDDSAVKNVDVLNKGGVVLGLLTGRNHRVRHA